MSTDAKPGSEQRRMCDFFLDQATEKLKQQMEWANDLDTKVSILMGIAGVVLAIGQPAAVCIWLRALTISALVGSIILGLLAYRLRDYEITPDVKHLWEKYQGRDELEVKETLTSTLVRSAHKNESRLRDKATWAARSFYVLLTGLGLYAADRLIQLLK